jgi:DNA repair exonuclease SbcCD ATPase subunit
LISEQNEKVQSLIKDFDKMSENLQTLKSENLADKVKKIEQVYDLENEIKLKVSKLDTEFVKTESTLKVLKNDLVIEQNKLSDFERALTNDENIEVVQLRSKIAKLIEKSKLLNSEKIRLATLRGKLSSDIEKLETEIIARNELSMKLKLHELISTAFSKKGLPTVVVNSQLPLINEEIAKILHGIVDFTVQLEIDQDSDSLEAYLDYGDSRRIIELGSGMEKMISSIAIRVALVNISSLPKTDMFIIDEGFGALDAMGVEACNRLLMSLKRYFRLIIVITHIDGIKDSADHILEITKNEKDTKVYYVGTK